MKYKWIIDGSPGDERFFLGNEAIVRGALESGIDIYTFYPGTPSSEVGEIFTEIFNEVGMKWVESSINEKVAIEVAGAAYARGATAMVGMKNAGLNVASDPLFALATTYPKNKSSAIVIFVADDPEQHSSAVEMDSRYYLSLFKIPALEPSNPQECLEFVKSAFEMSRELKLPVILRTVTMVSHARSNVVIGKMRTSEIEDEFNLSKEVNTASRLYFLKLKEDQIYNRMNQALKLSEKSSLNRIEHENVKNEFGLGIITSGVSYSYVNEALDFLELHVPVLKIGIINPLPERKIVRFLEQFKEVLVVEENDAFIETQILAIAHKNSLNVKIHGKSPFSYSKEALFSFVGELNPTKVALALIKLTNIKSSIDLNQLSNMDYQILPRIPRLCAGCPHRTTGFALRQAIKKIISKTGKKIYFFQDIGCYTLLAYPPISFANVKYCMGSSIALAQGVARTSESLNIAIIGDGTFFHSGVPALLNTIHNKTPVMILILDNGWIGMTGQQPHPGSDTRHYEGGDFKANIDLEAFLKGTSIHVNILKHYECAEGTYFNELKQTIYENGMDVLKQKSPHVIVVRDECIQKYNSRYKSKVRYIKEELCNNCGICYSEFLCPAIYADNGTVYIRPNVCLGCGICEQICPNNAIKKEG
ncbi:MAG: thiamine pyrophosphate-dependent enzyme [Promethearchaeota archaeon]